MPGLYGDEIGRGAPATAERQWRNAGVRAPATRVSYSLPDLAQKKEGGNAVLTEGSGRRMRDAGSAVTLIGGVVRAELADRAMWWSSWLRDSLDRCGVLLRRRWKGQRDQSITGGEESGWRSLLPAASIG